jgi:hypothetical protein
MKQVDGLNETKNLGTYCSQFRVSTVFEIPNTSKMISIGMSSSGGAAFVLDDRAGLLSQPLLS